MSLYEQQFLKALDIYVSLCSTSIKGPPSTTQQSNTTPTQYQSTIIINHQPGSATTINDKMASTTPITPLTPYNYTYQAIPSAFVFSLLPHFYYTGCLLLATRNSMSVAHPRTNLDAWKSKLPQELWNHLTRARGAHLNSMEVFPLFAAAMVSTFETHSSVRDAC